MARSEYRAVLRYRSTYQALLSAPYFGIILILVVAPPILWLFRLLRISLPVQIVVGVTIAAFIGAAVIHLDPAFPKPILAAARFEGVLTGLTSGALFWLRRSRMLRRRAHQSPLAIQRDV